MRQIDDRLNPFLEPCLPHFIKQNGEEDGNREPDKQIQKAEPKGVPYNLDRTGAGKQNFKIFQANPWTVQNTISKIVIFESDHKSAHRPIFKQNVVSKDRDKHDKKRNVLFQSSSSSQLQSFMLNCRYG